MKRNLSVFLLFCFGFVLVACQTTTSSSLTDTTSTTPSTTSSETSTSTTQSPTTQTTTLTTFDYDQIVVSGFSTNQSLRFSPINQFIAGWSNEHNDIASITLDDKIRYQPFYGAGAALTYSSAYVINQSPDREQIIDYLFSKSGLGINVVRFTVGASDFVPAHIGHYTYNDTVNNTPDLQLNGFSIEIDRPIIDIAKQALEMNPDITFMAAPWSAPAWMKDNKSLYMGRLKSEYQSVYADYLVKYLLAMQAEGIHIRYLSVQNEPFYASNNYPGMLWDRFLTTSFVRDFLGPKIQEAELTTKIMIWDHNPVDNNGNFEQLPFQVLRNEGARAFVGAIGVHCYTGTEAQMKQYLTDLQSAHPDIEVWMTECTAITTYTNIENNIGWSVRRMYLEAYNRYAYGTAYWNMVLDPQGTVHLGGCGNCTGLLSVPINGSSGFSVEADGYLTGHLNRTIPVGSRRIYAQANQSNLIVTAFVSEDGLMNVVLYNDSATRGVVFIWRDSRFRVAVPQKSITTLTWQIPN